VDYERLRDLLSAERLGSYLSASDGDLEEAFALYEWNIEASAAALSLSYPANRGPGGALAG
jgi:hypothetical protein